MHYFNTFNNITYFICLRKKSPEHTIWSRFVIQYLVQYLYQYFGKGTKRECPKDKDDISLDECNRQCQRYKYVIQGVSYILNCYKLCFLIKLNMAS
jgi:hypothetical protein